MFKTKKRPPSDPSGGFKNNFTGKQKITGKGSFLKKKGPLGLIITIVLGGGLGFSTLLSPGLLLVQMKEVMVNKFNSQLASMDVRSTKILTSKMGTTSGLCNSKISIRCKYSSMSDKQVSKFEKAGIKVNSEKTTLLGRSKPTSFDFNGENIKPNEFNTKLASSAEFRSAVKQAYNPKFAGFADSIWNKAATKLGISKKGANLDGTTDDQKLKSLQEDTKNPANNTRTPPAIDKNSTKPDGSSYTPEEIAAANQAADAANGIADGASGVESTATKAGTSILSGAETVGSVIKVTGIADSACTAYGAVQAVGYAAKMVRAVQLARYAMVFLNVADQIKAGTAKPEDVSYLGKTLTTTVAAKGTTPEVKSATDSFGYKFAAYGDRGAMSLSATQFLAGGGLTGKLIGVSALINSTLHGTPRTTCGTLKNPFVAGASFIAGIALMFVPGANFALSAKDVAQGLLIAALSVASAALPAMLQDIVAGVMVDKTTVGEASGDAIASGASGLMGTTANTGGNAPLTPTQAVAYNNLSTNVAAQYAQEDQLAYSPFDVTNSNTFMGKVALQLLPYTSKMSSLSGIFSSVASLTTGALGSITSQNAKATDNIANYQMCQDFDYNDLKGDGSNVKVATDPYCNITYGIPPEALNADPIAVVDALGTEIDPVTGDPAPGSQYEAFVTECINRNRPLGDTGPDLKEPDGSKCLFGAVQNDGHTTNNNYYIHYIDQRIDAGMDGYDSGTATTDAGGAAGGVGTPDNVTPKGTGWTLTDGLNYSAIACAPGTTNDSLYTHPVKKFIIRTCSLAGDQVASIVSQKAVALFAAAKAAGINLTLSSGFRSYEEQAVLYSQNCNSAGVCNPATAKPGNSQHEAGIALDIEYNGSTICYKNSSANCHNNAGFDWLKANADKYGFINLPDEAWHWSTSGT